MLSPLAGEMNRHTSSSPSGVSQPCRRPRCTAKQSAVSSSGPRNWWPHSCAWIHSLTGVETLAQQLGIEDEEARIGGAVVVELVVEDGRPLAAQQLAAVELQLAGADELGVAADVGHVLLRRGAG